MNPIFGIFRKKLILKHFMHRTVPKWCVLGVFWTAQYVSEVYFTWRRLLLTLLTSFYGYNAFECIYILLTQKQQQQINFHSPTVMFWRFVLEWYFSWFLQKNQETFILTWILFFHFPVKLVLPIYGPFSWSTSHISILRIFKQILI